MEKFETQEKITKLSEQIQDKEIGELEERKAQLQKQLEDVEALISMKKQSVAGTKEAMKRGEIAEKIGEWKEKQKEQAKAILKKFFEKEEEKERTVDIDAGEQEKLIAEALRERDAERLTKESPAYESLKIAQGKEQGELLESKELEPEEKAYIEKNEMPEKVKNTLIDEAKKLDYSAEKMFEHCEELEGQMKKMGIDVEKVATSFKERIKLRTKMLFNKKFKKIYQDYERTSLVAAHDKNQANYLAMAANEPKKYNKLARERDFNIVSRRTPFRRDLPVTNIGPWRFGGWSG